MALDYPLQPIRVVFFGTPGFAVPSLQALHAHPAVQLVGIVTAPDKPAGRGKQLQQPEVKQAALKWGVPILQPTNLKSAAFQQQLQVLDAHLFYVVAFRMLPEAVWAMPPLGSINLHGSLLPDYRGAAPIHWAVINGETETGLTTFFLQQAIDTGALIAQRRHEIPHHWTTGQLHDALMALGAELTLETVLQVAAGPVPAQPQDASKAIHKAPKLSKDIARIEWRRPSRVLYNFIRGLSPHPCAWTTLGGKKLKIYFAEEAPHGGDPLPGTTLVEDGRLLVATADGWLALTDIQLEGKKRMPTAQLLNGLQELPERLQ